LTWNHHHQSSFSFQKNNLKKIHFPNKQIAVFINDIYLTKKQEINKMIGYARKKKVLYFKEGYILSFWPLVLDTNGNVLLRQTLSSNLFVLMQNIQEI
jgi:hypothetical protein